MSAQHDDHGNTPAAWTTVVVVVVAFVVGSIGVVVAAPWLFWVGVGIAVLGVVIGYVMRLMGMGKQPAGAPESAGADAQTGAH